MPSTFQLTVSMLISSGPAKLPKSCLTVRLYKEQRGSYLCWMERIFTLTELDEMAQAFWESFPDKKIYAFQGEMGAGKTSLIRALCLLKKVKDPVGSPTFSIINEYRYPGGTIYHMDLYRLKDEEEALRAGVEDALYSNEICLVEWPDRAPGIFPDTTLVISLEFLDEKTRKILAPSVLQKNSG
jgi:tRNA threonylcarbamoyladenosine biosynthesis protein TsaE